MHRALLALTLLAACRHDAPAPRAPPAPPVSVPREDAATPALRDAAPAPVLRAEELPAGDAPRLTVCGRLEREALGLSPAPAFYRWGLRAEGESRSMVYFGPPGRWEPPPGLVATGSPRVCATGRYFDQMPLAPGDPPYASRFNGHWLYEVELTR